MPFVQQVDYLFVYGTLKRVFHSPMHRLLTLHADYLGEASVTGRLYDLGAYPGLVLASDAPPVFGELYRIKRLAPLFAALDAYEGCAPGQKNPEYRREVAKVLTKEGTVAAWLYRYIGPIRSGCPIVSGCYRKR